MGPSSGTKQVDANVVRLLREKTNCGMDCRKALDKCDGDLLLAEGFLRFNGVAVNVRPKASETPVQAYDAWVMERARTFAEQEGAVLPGRAGGEVNPSAKGRAGL